jgi:hypothetical protein
MYIGENKMFKFERNVLQVRRREKMDEQKTMSTDQKKRKRDQKEGTGEEEKKVRSRKRRRRVHKGNDRSKYRDKKGIKQENIYWNLKTFCRKVEEKQITVGGIQKGDKTTEITKRRRARRT